LNLIADKPSSLIIKQGRGPVGFDWDRRNGCFAPITQPQVGKRKTNPYEGESSTGRQPKRQSKKKRATEDEDDDDDSLFNNKSRVAVKTEEVWWEENEVDDTKKTDFRVPRRRKSPPPQAGEASAEASTPDDDDIKLSEIQRNATKLEQMMPLDADASAAQIAKARSLLVTLNKAELSYGTTVKSLQKTAKKLRKHTALKGDAMDLLLKCKEAYYTSMMQDLKRAVDAGNSSFLESQISALFEKITSGKKPLDLDRDFIEKHNLKDLIAQISLLFLDDGIVSAALTGIETMVNDSDDFDNVDV